jgi:outer membrane biosynthesis protein TonB
MSEELFERYLRNDLDEEGARRLSDLLSTEEGARSFSEFVQEWTLLGEAAQQRVAEADRQGSRRIRKRTPAAGPARAWIGWAAGLAAAVLFMIALATPTRLPAPAPVSRVEPPPSIPIEAPPPPVPEPERPPAPRLEPEPPQPPVPPPSPAPRIESPTPPPPPPPKPVVAPTPDKPRTTESEKAPRPVIALLRRAAGEVAVVSPAGRRKAAPSESLAPDEGIDVTGAHSQASLEFPDTTRIDVNPESTLTGLTEKSGRKAFTLARGSISASVVKQPAGRSVAVSTPHAEISVLGTQFVLIVTAESTKIDVREGRVRVTRLPDGASVEVAAGHTSTAMKGVKLESKPTVFTRDFQDGAGYVGTRDTSISGADPARSFGNTEVLEIDGDEVDGKKIYGLIKWDLSDLPASAVIRSAVITLNVVNESKGTGYFFYEMKRAWSEEATWTHAAPQQPWRIPGLKAGIDRGTEALGTVAPRMKGPLAILLPPAAEAVLQGWIRKPDSNHGFVIASDSNSDGFKFHSREAIPHDLRPKLTLTYTLAR